jgi:hypothetical protein
MFIKGKLCTSGVTEPVWNKNVTYNFQKSAGKVIFFMLQLVMCIVITDIEVGNDHIKVKDSVLFP